MAENCAHTRLPPVSPGAVPNTSSLFTYDSSFLVSKFLNQPKHDPNFKPLFFNELTLSQVEAVSGLCENDRFCILDAISTGSVSVGNATRTALRLHQERLGSLQPGKGWQGGQGVDPSGCRAPLSGQQLRPVLGALPLPQWCPAAGYPHPRMGTRKA